MTMKQLEEEISRLKAEAATTGEALKAKDSEITALKAKDEASQKTIAELTAQVTAANDTAAKLKASNESLSAESQKLKADVEAAQKSASQKALEVVAASGHPAPIEGQTPKDDGEKKLSSKLSGRDLLAAHFNKQFEKAK